MVALMLSIVLMSFIKLRIIYISLNEELKQQRIK